MIKGCKELYTAIAMLKEASREKGKNLQMPGDGRYQPKELKAFLGYDQWAAWLIIVEWFWMKTLATIGVMPREDADLLTDELLSVLLLGITTTLQDAKEKEKGIARTASSLVAFLRHFVRHHQHRVRTSAQGAFRRSIHVQASRTGRIVER
ncbi:MAG: hypothetical protein US57_C0021G0017 [Candidatus Moranbacteria bacterium GW2011_GWC2_37_73]|nr:MAG: hypothetical protein US57_C0021G0017 [Candidatus Moranbacteria bacterium GW2011_GWC2_37_73]